MHSYSPEKKVARSYDHTHHAANALVNTNHSAVRRVSPAAPVARHTHVDERTHTKTFYERDGHGREAYGTYYNSNDDPAFQARYNKDGSHAFVTTSAFTFVSHNGAGRAPRAQPYAAPTTTVVEEASPEPEDTYTHRGSARSPSTHVAQPVVEEPDDDAEDEYGYTSSARKPRATRYDTLSRDSPLPHPRRTAPSQQYRDTPDMYQLSPFARPNMLMRDFFMDDFFDGPRNPFGMFDAMRRHMSQHRAAMFGGVDPFADFF